MRCWELDMGPLVEQAGLLTTVPSLFHNLFNSFTKCATEESSWWKGVQNTDLEKKHSLHRVDGNLWGTESFTNIFIVVWFSYNLVILFWNCLSPPFLPLFEILLILIAVSKPSQSWNQEFPMNDSVTFHIVAPTAGHQSKNKRLSVYKDTERKLLRSLLLCDLFLRFCQVQ